jgi:hypothetical protein
MVLEGLLRAFWPLAAFLATAWAVFAFGLAEALTRPQMLAALAGIGLAALVLAVGGLRRFRWPSRFAARARLDATLPGRPLETLDDRPAIGADDPAAQAVWSAHLDRMARIAARARALRPDLRLAARDPWALRLAALVAVIAALFFARDPAVDSVSAALAPDAAATVATGPSYEGWAEPPVYTGRPTLYLPEVSGETPVSLPEGTRVTLRVYGAADGFDLAEDVSGTSAALAEPARRAGTARCEPAGAAAGNAGRPAGHRRR